MDTDSSKCRSLGLKQTGLISAEPLTDGLFSDAWLVPRSGRTVSLALAADLKRKRSKKYFFYLRGGETSRYSKLYHVLATVTSLFFTFFTRIGGRRCCLVKMRKQRSAIEQKVCK